jgi:ribosomal protein S2
MYYLNTFNACHQPDLCITFSYTENLYSIYEFFVMGVPLICLSDSNANPNLISYPVISNDDNLFLSSF